MLSYLRSKKSFKIILMTVLIFITASVSAPRQAAAFGNEMAAYIIMTWRLFLITPMIHIFNFKFRAPLSDPLSYGQISGNKIDGDQLAYHAAFPIPINDRLTLGVLGGYGNANMEWDRYTTDVDGDMFFGGLYAVCKLPADTSVYLNYTYANIDSDFDSLGSSGSFDTDIHTIKAEATKNFDMGRYWLEPVVGIVYGQAEREEFVDSLWSETTEEVDIKLTSFKGGLTAGMPIQVGYACTESDTDCHPGLVFMNATVFHDNFDDVDRDPTFPASDRPDEDYWGVEATVGVNIPVSANVSTGATLNGFSAGSFDGYKAMLFVNFYGLW